jgi:two-component system phosphate regulon response regulator PhoB
MTKHILVVDDEPDILEIVKFNLETEGYRVSCARTEREGRRAIRSGPDLILLDIMLPDGSGYELCRALKEDKATRHIPIIMLTAKGEEDDVVLGLRLGADDYVTLPFGVQELVERIEALFRRMQREDQTLIRRDGFELDIERRRVTIDGVSVDFTRTEFDILQTLAHRPGRVYTRDQLVRHAIGINALVGDRTVDVHVSSLRRKLGPYADIVETVRGVGYRFKE